MGAGTISADVLYEKEITRLQSEISNLGAEESRLKNSNLGFVKENERLAKEIEKQKEQIASLSEQQKKAEADFKTANERSYKALEAQDKLSAEKLQKAEKKIAEAQEETRRANASRNQLVAIAEDQRKTVAKIQQMAYDITAKVEGELAGYIALGDPKTEIPEPKKK